MHALPRDSCPSLIKKICAISGRPRGNVRRLYISRNLFRHYADHGQLSGVQRATW
jgi:small subunit ribosomal protein S14